MTVCSVAGPPLAPQRLSLLSGAASVPRVSLSLLLVADAAAARGTPRSLPPPLSLRAPATAPPLVVAVVLRRLSSPARHGGGSGGAGAQRGVRGPWLSVPFLRRADDLAISRPTPTTHACARRHHHRTIRCSLLLLLHCRTASQPLFAVYLTVHHHRRRRCCCGCYEQ